MRRGKGSIRLSNYARAVAHLLSETKEHASLNTCHLKCDMRDIQALSVDAGQLEILSHRNPANAALASMNLPGSKQNLAWRSHHHSPFVTANTKQQNLAYGSTSYRFHASGQSLSSAGTLHNKTMRFGTEPAWFRSPASPTRLPQNTAATSNQNSKCSLAKIVEYDHTLILQSEKKLKQNQKQNAC